VILLFLLCAIFSFSVTTEDAYISFRYAENIAGGHGIVFNRGGDTVEGYSNPTWVALLVLTNFLGINTIFAGRCLGLLFGALTFLEFYFIFKLLKPKADFYSIFPILAFMTAPMFLFWTQTGLENALFIYLLTIGMRLVLTEETIPTKFPVSAIAYFLLAITRPEGIMYFAIVAFWKIVNIYKSGNKQQVSRLLLWAGIVIVPFVIFLIWRYFTFGDLVPNTFFAKVNNGVRANLRSGTRYMLGFLGHALWMPLIIPVVVWLGNMKLRIEPVMSRFIWLLIFQAVTLLAFILYVGGDIHPYDRFGVPFILFSVLATFTLLPTHSNQNGLRKLMPYIVTVIIIIANLFYSFPPAHGIQPPIPRPPNNLIVNIVGVINGQKLFTDITQRFANPPVDALEFVGCDLYNNTEIRGLLAAEQCGKIPYFYDEPVLDLLGLNDRDIARIVHANDTWDHYAREIFKHAPENFVMVYRNGHLISRYYIENTILSLPFENRYELDAIYHIDYYFTDLSGIEHTFNLELVRYRAKAPGHKDPLTVDEEEWLAIWKDVDISAENKDLYKTRVEAFREGIIGNREKYITFRVDLN